MNKKNTKKSEDVLSSSDEKSEEVVNKGKVSNLKSKMQAKRKTSNASNNSDKKEVKKPLSKTVHSKSAKNEDSEEESDEPKISKNGKGKKSEEEDDGESHKELFVKNLSWESTEDSIWKYFGTFGEVTNVKLLKDKFSGKPKGIGFVEFGSRADAKNALDNVGEVDGRTPICSWSNDKSGIPTPKTGGDNQRQQSSGSTNTIFVGNIGFKTNENSIKKFFSRAGTIVGVRIATHEDGKAKGFCHVDFESPESVQAAIKFAGEDLDGREVRVDASVPREKSGGFGGGRGRGGRGGFGGGRGGGGRGGFGGGRGRGGFGGGRGRDRY